MAVAEQTRGRRKRIPLIEGRRMRCPRCKRLRDILAWIPMQQIEEFAEETHPIYKCPDCHWIFAPAAHVLEDFRD